MPTKTNLRNVKHAVANREDFEGSNLRGFSTNSPISVARLPERYSGDLATAIKEAPDFYVVFSYQTPVAWFANGVWFVPNVKYSVSTSRQLSSLGIQTDWANTPKDARFVKIGF